MEKVFNWFSIVFGALGGFVASALGGLDKWLIALAVFVALDYLTGIIKAILTKQLSSAIGFKGLFKKVLIFVIVVVGVILQGLLNNALPLRDMVICFYIANEGISLIENTAEFLPIPRKIKDVLLQIREKSELKEENENE